MNTATRQKRVVRVEPKYDVLEGGGVIVGRAIPNRQIPQEEVDPFLLWDEADIDPNGPAFPRHPHRGFEILTYILKGWANHSDSLGNKAKVHAGGIMRITAGSGLWHEEGFGEKNNEHIRGSQFWVNLPLAEKKRDPSVDFAEKKDLPQVEKDGVIVKTMVGEGSPVKIVQPMVYQDIKLEAGRSYQGEYPEGFQGFAYIMDGEGFFGVDEKPAGKGDMVVFDGEGTGFKAASKGTVPVHFLLALGKPLHQPIKWRGPYVD